MRKTIEEFKLELSKTPSNESFKLLSSQEQDACKGQGKDKFKKAIRKYKYSPQTINLPAWTMKYMIKRS